MKKQTRKLLSTVLSATTVMSMLTFMPAKSAEVSAYEENEDNLFGVVKNEDGTSFTYATGDRTLEKELPEDVSIIETKSDYYEFSDTNPKDGASSSLPESVDNSQSKYFPKIGNQGGIGACVAWAQSYYQFTYEMNKSRGVTTTPENTFSPKFTYNIANGGKDKGSFSQDVYGIMKMTGNVSITMVPYDNDCFSWSATEEIWREAINYRIKDYQYFTEIGNDDTQITSADDEDLTAIKTALSEGDVLTYSTCILDWKDTKIKANSATPENSKFVGESAVTHQAGSNGGHRMTLVGYNDNLWIDVNGNNAVDTGEMGAFKIANSWGDGYGNKGFIWVAYDALNAKSAVNGGPAIRVRIFTSIGRIDVKEYNSSVEPYMMYTLNTGDRCNAKVKVTAEKDGSKYTDYATPKLIGWENVAMSFDGTSKACDGTMVYPLDNIIPDLNIKNFSDYTWKVEFIDEEKNNIPLVVKNAEIINEVSNEVYRPSNVYPFTLEDSSKELTITETTSNNVVVYYRGLYNPILNYKVGNADWKTAQMEDNIERAGYTQKYIVELEEEIDVKIYFSDSKGNVDNNNGNYYTAKKGLNYFITENVADPLKVELTRKDTPVDIKKMLDFVATASGGYEPYKYTFKFTNLDTGEENLYRYLTPHGDNGTSVYNYGHSFQKEGNYKITVEVTDYSDNVSSDSLTMTLKDKPFEYTTFTATPDKQIMVGDTVELAAETNFENIIYVGRPKNMHKFTIKDESGKEVYSESLYAKVYSLNYKTSSPKFNWVPTSAGKYTITVSTTDGNNQYAEKSIKLDVVEYNGTMVGDANNNKEINITDALTVMKYNIGSIDSSKIWLALSDCNKDDTVDLRDAIYILRYIVSSDDFSYVGEVNNRETPTYPPTEAPTQAPTNPVEKNIVTFSNSHNWSGTIYCYYWSDTDKNMVTWPGKPMTYSKTNSYGQAQYTFTVPDNATYIIFSNGSTQTVDIKYNGGEMNYYPTTTNSKGHYNVATW